MTAEVPGTHGAGAEPGSSLAVARRRDAAPGASALAAAIGGIVACGVWLWAFLATDRVWVLTALLIAAAIGFVLTQRSHVAARCRSALAVHPRLGMTVSVLAALGVTAALRDQAYPLLMLCTVLLFVVACLGLNIQTGYAGIVNFAGAAFFGTGAYTAAVLAAHHVPHLLAIAAGGGVAAIVGSLLILPVLRTRGYYAALVTIAFGILFSTFLEVNNA
ncbi:MAG: ABC transporter permease subunit, partial [Casimicrobiaceae bacterium]